MIMMYEEEGGGRLDVEMPWKQYGNEQVIAWECR